MNCVAAYGNTVYAGRAGGGVEGSFDNANTWANCCYEGMTYPYIWCLMVDGTNVFAGTGSGVYLSSDSAASWIAISNGLVATTPFDTAVYALLKIGPDLFAGTGQGIFRSTNYGNSWSAVNAGLTNLSVRSLATDGVSLFAGTAGAGVFRSPINGVEWTAVNTGLTNGQIRTIEIMGSDVFVGTTGSGVFKSTNGGNNWTVVNEGSLDLNTTALMAVGNTLFAGTASGGVYVSSNGGASWNVMNSGLTATSITGLASNGEHLYASIAMDGVWKFDLAQVVGIQEAQEGVSMTVAPNPFSTVATLWVDRPMINARVTIHNSLGQVVVHMTNISGHSIELQREALYPGLYWVHLVEKDELRSVCSVLISD